MCGRRLDVGGVGGVRGVRGVGGVTERFGEAKKNGPYLPLACRDHFREETTSAASGNFKYYSEMPVPMQAKPV